MEPIAPKPPTGFSIKSETARNIRAEIPKDWPHAPMHRMTENGIYIVTASTLNHRHLFNTDRKRDLLERTLLSKAKLHGWDLEAWAVFANHYHFVARGNPDSMNLGDFITRSHSILARALNELDNRPNRQVWHNFWETRLTYQHAYLARLKYVHQNAVKHGLVATGNQYP